MLTALAPRAPRMLLTCCAPAMRCARLQSVEDFIGTVGAMFAGAVGPQLEEGARTATAEVRC